MQGLRSAAPGASTLWRWLRRAAVLAVIGLAAFLLYRTLSGYDFDDLATSVLSVPLPRLLMAIGWATASYLCLTGFDWLGLCYVHRRLPYRKVALASFVALSMGHNIGFAGLSSGAIRYRYYSREGLTAEDVAKLVVFCGMTVGLGLVVLAGVALLARPTEAGEILGLSRPLLLAIAGACLLVPMIYLGMAWTVRRPLCFYRWSVEMPDVRLALGQIVIGPLNFACVAACLHQVLSASADVSYLATASVYVLAGIAMLLAHVPGGLGVIEGVVVYLLPGSGVVGLVLVFRFVYFLLPLAIGGTLFALTELGISRGWWGKSKES